MVERSSNGYVYFRCGFAGTFTDFSDNGIVSTMSESSTGGNAKQTFSNAVCLARSRVGGRIMRPVRCSAVPTQESS